MKVGIIGVGNISGQYLDQIPGLEALELVAVADLDQARAAEVAQTRGVEALSVDQLLADPRIEAVLNLTIPISHVEIGLKALQAGKHMYTEKPLALSTAEAKPMIELAAERGLLVGCAPDTVLGTGIQTARAVLDQGLIGTPFAAQVHWSAPGHELWHPAPGFYYQPGGGPLFDMGPYYLASLVTLFGPVMRVSGATVTSSRERTVATGPQAGSALPVEVATHVSAVLEHASGVVSTITVSFEIWATRTPLFEVYGTQGTMAVPDPNTFTGSPLVAPAATREFAEVADLAGFVDAGRGAGLADLAGAAQQGRPARCGGELGFHVLEIMESVLLAGAEHRVVELSSSCERPAAVPLGGTPGRD